MQPTPIIQPPNRDPEPRLIEPSPQELPGAVPPDVPFFVAAGAALFVGFLAVALALEAPSGFFNPAVFGLAFVSWGTGILLLFLGLASRRIQMTRPILVARAHAGAGASRAERPLPPTRFRRVPPDALVLAFAGVSVFVGVLIFALPWFVPYPYALPMASLIGTAVVAWGLGILLLFVSLAARRVRESRATL